MDAKTPIPSIPAKPIFHAEEDFVLLSLRCCYELGGEASFDDMRDYIQHHMELTEADEAALPSTEAPRWHQILRNLKSNHTMEKRSLAVPVPKGFSITAEGVAYVEGGRNALGGHTRWKRVDRTLTDRETVCSEWGGKILIQLRDTKKWPAEEIIRDAEGGMSITSFREKYGLPERPSAAKPSRP